MSAFYKGDFTAAILEENTKGFAGIIADIKCVSPKEGDLLKGRDPVEAAGYLVNLGACALSVVTEKERFGGSLELLSSIVKRVNVPVLRKDFITEEKGLYKTAELGAAAVLLICAITDRDNLYRLYEKACELKLEPLVEVHTAEEMEFAKEIGAGLVGINNRDINTLELDNGGPSLTEELSGIISKDTLLISESGILSQKDAIQAVNSGANAILVGTALWKAHDMEEMFRLLHVEK